MTDNHASRANAAAAARAEDEEEAYGLLPLNYYTGTWPADSGGVVTTSATASLPRELPAPAQNSSSAMRTGEVLVLVACSSSPLRGRIASL
jgi:hypothetical protein